MIARTSSLSIVILVLAVLPIVAPGRAEDSDAIRAQFASPSRDFSTGPLWTWNDMLTESQVRQSLRDLAGQQVRQVWVHPRPGLLTPYLGEDWFRMWSATLDEAKKLDMNVWIYDENSYPSGFAGGLVPEALPDSRNTSLRAKESPKPPAIDDDTIAVFQLSGDIFADVTAKVRAGEDPGDGPFLTVYRVYAESTPWFGGKWYVDLLKPGVTEKFLEITLEPYRKRFGAEFGKRIPGVFTDEPNLFVPRGLPWTDDLPQRFEERWGHPLLENLPCLFRPIGDWRHIRHHFFQLVLELFIERWATPYHDYCEKYGLEFTGHYWEHGWPNVAHGPDSMAMYAWHQRPAIDILFNQYKEDTNAQFGNVRAVRELASVANQTGAKRTLCELYGAGGWDLRIEDMKRIGDWVYALGVNTLNEHISPVTIRGARKRDHPQTFTAHEPWWDAYHTLARYFTRLSLALSSGEQRNEILILEPTTTAWLHQSEFDPAQRGSLSTLGIAFFELLMSLERAQFPYDLGCEDVLRRMGDVSGNTLKVGRAAYTTLLIPPLTENLNAKTVDLLNAFVAAGGTIIACCDPPPLVDGQPSDAAAILSKSRGWQRTQPSDAPTALATRCQQSLTIRRAPGDAGILFQHRRHLDDGELLFLVNTSMGHISSGSVEAKGLSGVECWDPHTGAIQPAAFDCVGGAVTTSFDLPPCGSVLLFFTGERWQPPTVQAAPWQALSPTAPMTARRLQPNVLTIDFADITANGKSLTAAYCPAAADFAFQQFGLHGNPAHRGVQLRDEWLKMKFPPESGFEATYHFRIEGEPPKNLRAVIERADLYSVQCNGKPVRAIAGASWLEPAFRVLDIAPAAIAGENSVTLRAKPLSINHELEPAYVLGDFALKPADSGFVIVASDANLPDPLTKWNAAGLPLYGHDVAYAQSFCIEERTGRYRVELPSWHGSVARVLVNGTMAGYIGWQPYALDISEHIRPGENSIEVVISGTLKNPLGPHHCGELRGIAGPSHFTKGPKTGPPPGAQYDTIGYGLFAPFILSRQP